MDILSEDEERRARKKCWMRSWIRRGISAEKRNEKGKRTGKENFE